MTKSTEDEIQDLLAALWIENEKLEVRPENCL